MKQHSRCPNLAVCPNIPDFTLVCVYGAEVDSQ